VSDDERRMLADRLLASYEEGRTDALVRRARLDGANSAKPAPAPKPPPRCVLTALERDPRSLTADEVNELDRAFGPVEGRELRQAAVTRALMGRKP